MVNGTSDFDGADGMGECLARAEQTPGLDARQKKRLELVRLEFDYVAHLGRIDYLYGAYTLKPCAAFFGAQPPKEGDRWGFNLGRQALGPAERPHAYTFAIWNPNLESPSFTSPDAMGDLIFK